MNLPKNISINENTIELIDKKQPLYRPIYALNLVILKTLKTYIETYQRTGFIRSFKSSTSISIFFDKTLDGSVWIIEV